MNKNKELCDAWHISNESYYHGSSIDSKTKLFKLAFCIPEKISGFSLCSRISLYNSKEENKSSYSSKIHYCLLSKAEKHSQTNTTYYSRFREVELSSYHKNKPKYQGSIYFGEKIRVLKENQNKVEIQSSESGWRGWIPKYLITHNSKEISYFRKRQIIPIDGLQISIDEENGERRLLINPLCGVLQFLKNKEVILKSGVVLFFENVKNLNIFGVGFEKIKRNAVYIYNNKKFEELIPDDIEGFKVGRTLTVKSKCARNN